MDQTTNAYGGGTNFLHVLTFSLVLGGIGTGGEYTSGYHEARSEKAAFSRSRQNDASNEAINDDASPITTDIEHIKSALKISMRELSDCLGVSRQAPYNWMAGSKIKSGNLAKLNNLKAAADVIALARLPQQPLLLQRKISDGMNLFEIIAAGGDGGSAAESLLEIYRHEAAQRQMLAQLLPGRQQRARSGDPRT